MKTILMIVMLAVLFAPLAIAEPVMKDYNCYTYVVAYDTRLTLTWEADPTMLTPDGYEYYFEQMETGRKIAQGTAMTNSVTVRFRTHGHYQLWARSYKIMDGGVKQYGIWCSSADPAFGTVNGSRRGWVVYVLQQTTS